ncbi:MAG: pilus assembly protein [Xanthomonadales bacterium]|nr:pilus assembly protein [Xanthomonadales bacterium]
MTSIPVRVIRVPRDQCGAVLFVALIFLILLTLLALTATSTSILQEKMTGGMRNRQLSLIGAENVLRGGEASLWLLSFVGSQPLPPCVNDSATVKCVYRPTPSGMLEGYVQRFRSEKEWEPATPLSGWFPYTYAMTGLAGSAETAELGEEPRLMIEDLGPAVPPGIGQQLGTRDRETGSLVGKSEWYRVTARSTGGSDAVVRVTESVFSAIDLTNTGFNAPPSGP